MIISANTGWPGCVHDARVLRNSQLYQKAEQGQLIGPEKFLVGDSAYPLKAWLTAPFKNYPNLSPQQRLFNRKITSIRQVVERAIGHMKGRFRRLKNVHLYDVEAACKIIFAGCILHNLCILSGDEVEEFIEIPEDDDHPNNYPPVYRNADDGIQLRDRLVNQLQ